MGGAKNWDKTTDRSNKVEWTHDSGFRVVASKHDVTGKWKLELAAPQMFTKNKTIITTSSKRKAVSFSVDWRNGHTSTKSLYSEIGGEYDYPYKIGDWVRNGGNTWKHQVSDCKVMVKRSGDKYSVAVGDYDEVRDRKMVGTGFKLDEANQIAVSIMRSEPYLEWDGRSVVDQDGDRVRLSQYK